MKRFLAVLGVAVPTMVTAGVFYVPQDYATIQRAVYAAFSGDTIRETAGGTYKNLWIPKRIVLIGTGSTCIRDTTNNSGNGIGIGGIGDSTVIKGLVVKGGASGVWTFKVVEIESLLIDSAISGIWLSPGAKVTVTDVGINKCQVGIGIDSCTALLDKITIVGTGTSKGIYVIRKGTPEIRRTVITNCDMGMQSITAYPSIYNSVIKNSKIGIAAFDTSSIKVYNNIIRRSTENGIFLTSQSYAVVVNNTIKESNGNGIWVDKTNAQVINNIITDCVGCGIGSSDSVIGPTCSYNDLFSIGADLYWNTSPGAGAVTVDPEFTDDSLHLGSSSLCRNAGNPDTTYSDVNGTRNDMGAYGGPYGEGQQVGIEEKIPGQSSLAVQSSPNPFTQTTVISFQLPADSYVSLKLYDSAGRLVKTLINGVRPAGFHASVLEVEGGTKLIGGVYFVRLQIGGCNTTIKKIILVR